MSILSTDRPSIRIIRRLATVLLLVALLISRPTASQAASKTYYLNSSVYATFYDADGNMMSLILDVSYQSKQTVVKGVVVVLNGEIKGYAQPVLTAGYVDHWDARLAKVRLENGRYVLHGDELGPWFSEVISYDTPSTNAIPAQTAR